jgi:hypothetical protein
MNKYLLVSCIIGIVLCVIYILYTNYIEPPITQVKTQQEIVNSNIQKLKDNYVALEREQRVERAIAAENPLEIQRLKELLDDFKANKSWSSVIAMGDIYRKGAYPRFLPNEALAIELYRIVSMCPDGKMAADAQSKYVETRKEIINADDKSGKPLPTYYGEEALATATVYIQRTPLTLFEKPHFTPPKETHRNPRTAILEELPTQTNTFEFDMNYNFDALFERNRPEDINVQRSDGQNVHDHSVVQATKENIKKLKEHLSSNSQSSASSATKEEIIDAILSVPDLKEKDRLNALEVVEKLSTKNHSSLNISEQDALGLVWQKINNTNDTTLKENLKETLTKQLASAYEHGHVVCSTGKIARILGTFDGIDETAAPMKPMWAIKEEIGTLAAKVRDEHISSNRQNEQQMKEDFETKARSLYINQLGLKESIIAPIIEMYKAGF